MSIPDTCGYSHFEPLHNSVEEEPSPKPQDDIPPEAEPSLAATLVHPSPSSSAANDPKTAPAAAAASATRIAEPAAAAANTAPILLAMSFKANQYRYESLRAKLSSLAHSPIDPGTSIYPDAAISPHRADPMRHHNSSTTPMHAEEHTDSRRWGATKINIPPTASCLIAWFLRRAAYSRAAAMGAVPGTYSQCVMQPEGFVYPFFRRPRDLYTHFSDAEVPHEASLPDSLDITATAWLLRHSAYAHAAATPDAFPDEVFPDSLNITATAWLLRHSAYAHAATSFEVSHDNTAAPILQDMPNDSLIQASTRIALDANNIFIMHIRRTSKIAAPHPYMQERALIPAAGGLPK